MCRETAHALSRVYRMHRQFFPVIEQDCRACRESAIIYTGSTVYVVKFPVRLYGDHRTNTSENGYTVFYDFNVILVAHTLTLQ